MQTDDLDRRHAARSPWRVLYLLPPGQGEEAVKEAAAATGMKAVACSSNQSLAASSAEPGCAAVVVHEQCDALSLFASRPIWPVSFIVLCDTYQPLDVRRGATMGVDDWLVLGDRDLLARTLRCAVESRLRDHSKAKIAEALFSEFSGSGGLDDFCDALAEGFGADQAMILDTGRGGELVLAGAFPRAQTSVLPELGPGVSLDAIGSDAWEAWVNRLTPALERDCVELVADDRSVGAQIVARRGIAFSASERGLLASFANLAGLALARRQTLAQLARANSIKTEFVRTVSHELRTPLTTVIGYSELLTEEAFGPLDDEQKRILRRVGDRARGLLEVVAATLDLPGVAGGQVALTTREVSVVDLLRELEADTREWQSRRDLEYIWDVPADLPILVSDPGKVRVILKNLIANAAKFTDHGSITLRAAGRQDGVEFTVEDTGIGIDAAAVHYVFDAFRQVGETPAAAFDGVGLGLYIVRRLVAMLGGRLRVESEIDVGSKFYVWLPLEVNHTVPAVRG